PATPPLPSALQLDGLALALFHRLFPLGAAATARDLPSFPTRRSSDLDLGPTEQRLTAIEHALFPVQTRLDELESAVRAFRVAPRSEEHTSELQSPCNLVCRLLLEKKNRPTAPWSTAAASPCSDTASWS